MNPNDLKSDFELLFLIAVQAVRRTVWPCCCSAADVHGESLWVL